jgi:hypothetical protein
MVKIFGREKRSARENFWWATHNLVAHPLSEILSWFWLEPIGDWLHEATLPRHRPGTGRG